MRSSLRWSTMACLFAASPAAQGTGGRVLPPLDTVRARQLYVSKDPKDLPGCGGDCGVGAKRKNDSTWMANAPGRYDVQKVTYKSDVDGLDIPAHVYSPLAKPTRHPPLVLAHGRAHTDRSPGRFPFLD